MKLKSKETSTERWLIVWNMHLEGVIFLYYGTPTVIYAQYTSKEESERLQRKFLEHANECKKYNEPTASSYATRSQAEPVHGNKCIFCQRENPKGRLSAVALAKFRQPSLITIGPSQSCGRLWSDFSGGKVPCGVFAFFPKHSPQQEVKLIWMCDELDRVCSGEM